METSLFGYVEDIKKFYFSVTINPVKFNMKYRSIFSKENIIMEKFYLIMQKIINVSIIKCIIHKKVFD